MSRLTRVLLWGMLALLVAGSLTSVLKEQRRADAYRRAFDHFDVGDCDPYTGLLGDRPYDEAACRPVLEQRRKAAMEAAASAGWSTPAESIIVLAVSVLLVAAFRQVLRFVRIVLLVGIRRGRAFHFWLEVGFVAGVVALALGAAGLMAGESSAADRYLFALGAGLTALTTVLWYRRQHTP